MNDPQPIFTDPEHDPQTAPAPRHTGSRAIQLACTVFFLGIIAGGLLLQTSVEALRPGTSPALEIFRFRPTAANLRQYERNLEDASVLARATRPLVQYAQFAWLQDGGEKVITGLNGWLFYRPGFVDRLRPVTPAKDQRDDPLHAILEYRDALARRGIRLVLMPAPNKESIYPDYATRRVRDPDVQPSPLMRQFLQRLQDSGVETIDLFALYRAARQQDPEPLYLAQDTHWSPAGLQLAASAAAAHLLQRGYVAPGSTAYTLHPVDFEHTGDLLRMFRAPVVEHSQAPERLRCARVLLGEGTPAFSDPEAQVLVLGDSFLRIFESEAPGSAGFLARLAYELKAPVTSIINEGGASTLVRQELFRRPGLLKNKRVVLWEFVERDLRLGTEGWQVVPLPPEQRL